MLTSSLAPFACVYVPDVLLGEGDVLATAERVRASENLLRAGIVAELYSVTNLVFAALAPYELFKRVDPRTSLLMTMMMLLSVPISYVGALNDSAPLNAAAGARGVRPRAFRPAVPLDSAGQQTALSSCATAP